MKIYTKTGDQGETSLFGGQRVLKSHERVEAYGSLDELNAHVGYLRDIISSEIHKNFLEQIQQNLFVIGSHMATPPESEKLKSGQSRLKIRTIKTEDIELIEKEIDKLNEVLPPMTHFILPGGHPQVSYCHIVRTMCRKSERKCVKLGQTSPVDTQIITYLNRLSDYFFVLARKLAVENHVDEIKWKE
jgi:cob(I)alamin adenosyltransferase